jgi:integrase
MGKLTVRKVETAKPGKYGDGGGLQLSVTSVGSKKWVLRFFWQGAAREMGLGSYPEISLAEARERATAGRKLARSGVDPIAERKHRRRVPSFGELADEVVTEQSKGFRNEKHKAQWAMTLTRYAAPLRTKPVDEITTEDILRVLKRLWTEKPETASRLRGRLERVLSAAKAKGYRSGENPAAWRGHLDNLLSKPQKLSRGHHAALPYADVPTFVANLRERKAIAALALEFAILTAARSSEVLGARWEEIDFDARIWTIPAGRMKAARQHRVPLSKRAVAIVSRLNEARADDYVFPGSVRGRPLSVMAMDMVLRRMGEHVTVHGFRSSFRDWAGNETHFPREIAEHALAHAVGDKAEQAYRRSDALEKRRALMEAWAAYCEPSSADEKVTPLRRKA